MVAEGSVVGMFLDGHYLDGVVTVLGDAGQDVLAEFVVGTDALALLGHADMAFVDEQGFGVGYEVVDFPLIGLFGRPYLSREQVCLGILHHAVGVGGYAFAPAAVPFDEHLVVLAVLEGAGAELAFPHAVIAARESIFLAGLPVGEIADESDGGGIGSPFAEGPFSVGALVEAEILVGVGEVGQGAGFRGEPALDVESLLMATRDGFGKRFEPGVILYDGEYFGLTLGARSLCSRSFRSHILELGCCVVW